MAKNDPKDPKTDVAVDAPVSIAVDAKHRSGGPALVVFEGASSTTMTEIQRGDTRDVAVPHEDRLHVGDVVHLRGDGAPMHSGVLARVHEVLSAERVSMRIGSKSVDRVVTVAKLSVLRS